jgi:hypothetical protein
MPSFSSTETSTGDHGEGKTAVGAAPDETSRRAETCSKLATIKRIRSAICRILPAIHFEHRAFLEARCETPAQVKKIQIKAAA